ncbi:hypothetical protein RR46_00535 [Papilio xuthus]|uniref:Uncharacterized protein n=1 Tax=Papilio xuthus TaxID=66420 RepID=A0A0N1I5N5_PAPXU|nr:hypothetical protein RR46_00535 [Papilio xuthus]
MTEFNVIRCFLMFQLRCTTLTQMLYSVILFILKWLLMTKAAYDTSSKDITYWTTEKPDILSKIRHITETKDGKTNGSLGRVQRTIPESLIENMTI